MKRLQGVAAGVMVLTLCGAAFAEGVRGGSESDGSAKVLSSTDISSDYKASELKGMPVHNRQDEKLGTISDLVIGKDGKVSNVVLHEGGVVGLGGNSYLVPWERVQLTEDEKVARIDVTKDRLSSEFAALEENKDGSGNPEGTGKPSGTSPPTK